MSDLEWALARACYPPEDLAALRLAVDEAMQCPQCGQYDREHLALCPTTRKEPAMSQYRVVFTTTPPDEAGPANVEFVEAPSMAAAMAAVMLAHPEHCNIISARLEGAAITVEEQLAELIRALRPLHTVCRALLDNPSAAPLFTPEMRKGLEGMCDDAVSALKAAGVTR